MKSIKFLALGIIFMGLLGACNRAVQHTRIFSYPYDGENQNVNLAVKDFESKALFLRPLP